MNQPDVTKRKVVLQIPGMESVNVRKNIEFATIGDSYLSMDVYYPSNPTGDSNFPVLVFVLGYSDEGFLRIFGCKQKEMESYVSWGRLIAASGIVAITYTAMDPQKDVLRLLDYVERNADQLGLDAKKIGIWACSGNVPNALSLLMKDSGICLSCAVLNYGFLLDLEGTSHVADSAAIYKFANPCSGKVIENFGDTPMLVVRAGRDENAGLNETLDAFAFASLTANLPITIVNEPGVQHGFDLLDSTVDSFRLIGRILDFLTAYLSDISDRTKVSPSKSGD